MTDLVYLYNPEDYVELTPTAQGRLLRKKILPMNGSFIHPKFPDTKIHIDEKIAKSLVKNFNDRIVGKVQVPAVDGNNIHTEDPLRNLGEVVEVSYDDSGVYATIDARKYAEDFGKTILDSSAFLHMDYVDTTTGKHVGPTLIHVAATNRGHVRNMGEYEDIVKASADNLNENILFMCAEGDELKATETNSQERDTMTKDEMLAQLSKDDLIEGLKAHGVDVAEALKGAEQAAELSAQLDTARNELQLSADSKIQDLVDAGLALSKSNETLAARVEALEADKAGFLKREAEHEVDSLIQAGRILPAAREPMVKLSLSDRETFDALVPDKAVVQLSETGVTVHENPMTDSVKEIVNGYAARVNANRK